MIDRPMLFIKKGRGESLMLMPLGDFLISGIIAPQTVVNKPVNIKNAADLNVSVNLLMVKIALKTLNKCF